MEEFDPTLPNQTFVELQSGFEPEKVGPFLKHAAELGVAQKGVADGIYNAGIQHAAAIDTIEQQSSLVDEEGGGGGREEPMDTTDTTPLLASEEEEPLTEVTFEKPTVFKRLGNVSSHGLQKQRVSKLKSFARAKGVNISGLTKKNDIIRALDRAGHSEYEEPLQSNVSEPTSTTAAAAPPPRRSRRLRSSGNKFTDMNNATLATVKSLPLEIERATGLVKTGAQRAMGPSGVRLEMRDIAGVSRLQGTERTAEGFAHTKHVSTDLQYQTNKAALQEQTDTFPTMGSLMALDADQNASLNMSTASNYRDDLNQFELTDLANSRKAMLENPSVNGDSGIETRVRGNTPGFIYNRAADLYSSRSPPVAPAALDRGTFEYDGLKNEVVKSKFPYRSYVIPGRPPILQNRVQSRLATRVYGKLNNVDRNTLDPSTDQHVQSYLKHGDVVQHIQDYGSPRFQASQAASIERFAAQTNKMDRFLSNPYLKKHLGNPKLPVRIATSTHYDSQRSYLSDATKKLITDTDTARLTQTQESKSRNVFLMARGLSEIGDLNPSTNAKKGFDNVSHENQEHRQTGGSSSETRSNESTDHVH